MDYKDFIKNRELRLKILNFLSFIPDKCMLKLLFKISMHQNLNLSAPVGFNQKLQWLKLYDRNPLHTTLVDKYKVRDFVKERIGEKYLIPLLGKWDSYSDICFDKLPSKFVLKCNHDSGSIKIILDKNTINHKELKAFFDTRLKSNPYTYGREWPYKGVKPCIIAEQYMGNDNGELPVDYKFFCFDGYVDSVMVCIGRGTPNKRFLFFDKNWHFKKYDKSCQELPDNFKMEKPSQIDRLFELASHLSRGEQFVRIDFYIINEHIYFGEFTFYPGSGFDNELMPLADSHFGSLIKTNNCDKTFVD